MNFEQNLSMEQKIAQRIEARMLMTQNMVQTLNKIRESGEKADRFDSETLLPHVLEDVVENEANPQNKEGLKKLFLSPGAVKTFAKNIHLLAMPNKQNLQWAAAEIVYAEHNGVFEFEAKEGEEPERINIHRMRFIDAYRDENYEKKVKEAEGDIELAKRIGNDPRGATQQYNEIAGAFIAAQSFRAQLDMIVGALNYLVQKKDEGGEMKLFEFARDSVILRKLDMFSSERFFKRTVDRAKNMHGKGSFEKFKSAFVNMVSEYVLLSLGVLDREMFTLVRNRIPGNQIEELEKEFANDGFDLNKMLEHYNLRPEKTYFWYRWKVQGKRPTAITDEAVRAFMTEIVSKDSAEFIPFFENFFNELQGYDKSNRDEFDDSVRSGIKGVFENDEFQIKIAELIKSRWADPISTSFFQEKK